MILNRVVVQNLLEAAEAVGVAADVLLAPLETDAASFSTGSGRIEWKQFADMLEHLSGLLDHDPERLREVGRRMALVPSYALVRRLARTAVSVPMLYRAVDRWLTSSNFPHLSLFIRFRTEERMEMRIEIPAPYVGSEPFFRVSEGAVAVLPEVVGLAPAVIVHSHVTPRVADLHVRLPRMPTRVRLHGIARTLFGRRSARADLEEQRRELADNVEALARAREELRTVLDRLPNLVVVHVAGRILWVNRPWLNALEYEQVSDVVGTSVLDHTSPRSRQYVAERMGHAIDAPDTPELSEVILVGRAGKEVVVEVAPPQTVVFEGTPARLVVARDVTDRVMMQQRLLVADRMAAVGLLAAGVAHEVNNPLAYVLNNIELARNKLAGLGSSAELARESLSVALEGVDRIRTVVRDLLLLARGEDRIVGLVDVRTVSESTIALARPDIEAVATLVVDFTPAPLVHATEGRVAQILLNLIGNALESMRDLPREKCTLTVRVAGATDDRVLLEVSDSGRGIAAFDVGRVFEPFFTTKPAGKGTGLGLPIVQRLVMELGGEIAVESTLGRGASFRVLLPPAPPLSDSAASDPAQPAAFGAPGS